MRSLLVTVILASAALSVPLASAQAGFFTDVAKGTVKNAARHAKQTAKDSVGLGRLVGRCVLNRATGRQC